MGSHGTWGWEWVRRAQRGAEDTAELPSSLAVFVQFEGEGVGDVS